MVKLRFSTLEERREFYEREFDFKKMKSWFKGRRLPQICAIDAGTDTNLLFKKEYKGKLFYFRFSRLKEMIKRYVPEDIYYDRSIYENPKKVLETLNFHRFREQELAFDIDADNLKCKFRKEESSSMECIKKAFVWAKKMKKELEKNYENVRLVYSGRGFHVHVLDKKAAKLSIKEREELNKRFKDYPIDPWVSRGHIRLIRMPYSLNSLVSRRVIPLKNNKFDAGKTIPKFMKS